MVRKLLCFGDSNTYGYDPRSYLGSRYPESVRWTGLLGGLYEVWNAGENGRMIPRRPEEIAQVQALLRRAAPLDAAVIMLGGNDLLCGATAEVALERMRGFLSAILPVLGNVPLLLVAPPPMRAGAWVTSEELVARSIRYGQLCRSLAEEMGAAFAGAGEWDVDLTFDGVHFSEAGHASFARGLCGALAGIFGG